MGRDQFFWGENKVEAKHGQVLLGIEKPVLQQQFLCLLYMG